MTSILSLSISRLAAKVPPPLSILASESKDAAISSLFDRLQSDESLKLAGDDQGGTPGDAAAAARKPPNAADVKDDASEAEVSVVYVHM